MHRRFQRMLLLLPAAAVLALAMITISGCKTVEGLGEDISGAARGVSSDGNDSN